MKKNIIMAVLAILIGGAAFYGGMVYDKKINQATNNSTQHNWQNLIGVQRTQVTGGRGGMGFGGRQSSSTDFVNGEILSKGDDNISVKTSEGGSLLVFISTSTTSVIKQTTSTVSDIKIGDKVMVNGIKNNDGSYSAKMIRL